MRYTPLEWYKSRLGTKAPVAGFTARNKPRNDRPVNYFYAVGRGCPPNYHITRLPDDYPVSKYLAVATGYYHTHVPPRMVVQCVGGIISVDDVQVLLIVSTAGRRCG